jgi:hypothetical protein
MSKARDVEVDSIWSNPKEHYVCKGTGGRRVYPFRSMVIGDFVTITAWEEVLALRNSLKTYYRKRPRTVFTVRQKADQLGIWICRRMK